MCFALRAGDPSLRGNVRGTELAPVAEQVISLADLERGEVVVDLAAGTGNAALLAARVGAVVTGLDSAPG